MVFQEGGDVTFWMNQQQRVDTKTSHYDQPQLKDNKNDELFSNIKSAGVDVSVVKEKRVGDMQDILRKNSISVTKIIRKERVKIWMGNPKGLLQVLQERIFMDASKDVCTYYTLRV